MKSLVKVKPETTIGDEIAQQLRNSCGGIARITLTEDEDGNETAFIVDDVYEDITIIQSFGNEMAVTHLDSSEIKALKAITL